jgi:hypothetical protein
MDKYGNLRVIFLKLSLDGMEVVHFYFEKLNQL